MRPLVRLAKLAVLGRRFLVLAAVGAAAGAAAGSAQAGEPIVVVLGGGSYREARTAIEQGRARSEAGKPKEALPLADRAVYLLERSSGAYPSDLAEALLLRGSIHDALAEADKADTDMMRATNLYMGVYGPESSIVAVTLRSHGVVRSNRGDRKEALELFTRALAIAEKALPPSSEQLADFLQPLADEHIGAGDLTAAAPLLARALALRDTTANKDPIALALILESSALLQSHLGDDTKALALYQRALDLRQRALGPSHLGLTTTLHAIAVLRGERGATEEAMALEKRVIAIREERLGPQHPDLVEPLESVAGLYLKQIDVESACQAVERANEIVERTLRMRLRQGSERETLAYLAMLSRGVDQRVYRAARLLMHHGRSVRAALTSVFRYKGRALDAQANSIAILRRRLPPEKRGLLDELREAEAELAALSIKGAASGKPDVDAQRRLQAKIESTQDWIASYGSYFREEVAPITFEGVQASIPEGAALVEYYAYNEPGERSLPGALRYAAFVVRRRGAPVAVDIGAASVVDAAIQRAHSAFASAARADYKALATDLDERIFRPLVGALGDASVVYIAPDRALNLLPFEALVAEDGRPRVERYAFTYVASGRDLTRFSRRAASRAGSLIVADPDFNASVAGGAAGAATSAGTAAAPGSGGSAGAEAAAAARGVEILNRARFSALKGTAEEGEAVAVELPGAMLRTGDLATKAALLGVHGPAIVHIATHGFFLPKDAASSSPSARPTFDNPLLRSGLALAGANQKGEKAQSILTALEVAGLDFEGTHLVTLSACETGLGDVAGGDGVYGLRRAFAIAGAETTVMSLWKVSDEATRDLMISYYRRLRAGEGASEALRQARLELMRTPGREHPYSWASFIVSGDPSPILPAPPGARTRVPAVTPPSRGCACEVPDERPASGAALAAAWALGAALWARRRSVNR